MKFKVYWDNGADACGTFPELFDSEEDAVSYGEDWIAPMTDDKETYSYHIIEIPSAICSICNQAVHNPLEDRNGLLACDECATGTMEEHDARGLLNYRGQP